MAAKNLITLSALVFLIAFQFVGQASAQCASADVVLPFTVARSLILVPVTVDGQLKILIFDSGAERTMIQDSRNIEHHATLILAGKTLTNFPVALVSLTGMQLEKVNADGVLGQDVLSKFPKVTIDYKAHQIELVR